MSGRWPEPSLKPTRALQRHLREVHGLRVTGEETLPELDEAEGWISRIDHHESCLKFYVNRGAVA